MLDRYRILSDRVILMSVRIAGTPYGRTTEVHGLTDGITAVDVEFGYREPLRVFDALLSAADRPGSAFTASQVAVATFVLSNETTASSRESALPYWQQRLFIALRRGAAALVCACTAAAQPDGDHRAGSLALMRRCPGMPHRLEEKSPWRSSRRPSSPRRSTRSSISW